ncbi:MAG: DUF1415 family protein [Methyloprofundus sp.]|nr:DUF1415 family protein [Methyloprofundus sp.]
MGHQNEIIIAQTKQWLKDIVIGLNFCPFAKPVFEQEKIHYQVSAADSLEACLQDLIAEAERLDNQSELETILVIYPNCVQDFDDFLELLEIANDLMHAQAYEGVYQLASFHPEYCFSGSDAEDPANYTNRSPYPMLHLIRESSLALALENYKDPEKIPDTNVQVAQDLGLEKMQELLAEVMKKK